jgi:hypothetical protein
MLVKGTGQPATDALAAIAERSAVPRRICAALDR